MMFADARIVTASNEFKSPHWRGTPAVAFASLRVVHQDDTRFPRDCFLVVAAKSLPANASDPMN
jgi:hypothetical protein